MNTDHPSEATPIGEMVVPSVEGVLTADDVRLTAETIAEWQLPSGMIQWFPGGHADPWNHVEAAMALATAGLVDEAERGYQWLYDLQRADGSWHNYYLADGVEDDKLDVNCIAYIATGVWHHFLATEDWGFLETLFPVVDRAIDFVLDLQTIRGEILWAKTVDGQPWSYALLTGSASIGHSLGCAVRVAETLGYERPNWSTARSRLMKTVAHHPEAFAPKERWAMDWYYPVLTGAITGPDAAQRLVDGWDEFVMIDRGVRCVSDQPWVTAAETCECVIALLAAGDRRSAENLFRWTQAHRHDDGSYFTGLVYPENVHYPDQERTAYTAAAVILAADALDGSNPTSNLFTVHDE